MKILIIRQGKFAEKADIFSEKDRKARDVATRILTTFPVEAVYAAPTGWSEDLLKDENQKI